MIIENKTTENGDVLHISTDVPVLGLVLLYGFIDNTSGETADMYYQKKFRYSKDIGTNWSDWQNLTAANLQNVPIKEKESFLFEYTYEHEGQNGELYFNWVQLEGEVRQGDDTIYSKTDFKQFFDVNDINVLGWAFNVLEKLYELGILPKYVQRDYTENSKDFIDYWLSITHFFALIVYMARQFEDIPGNNILFNLFLEGRGLALSGEETQLQRNYLFSHYIDEFRKRGTRNIIDMDGTVNGEFLRLINYNPDEEFMFFNLVRQDLGWCCDFSSPMWIGTEQIVNAMKAYEYTESIKDISKYPVVGSVDVFQHGLYEWLRLATSAGTNGIEAPVDKEKLLKISPSIPYEIYFRVIAISGEVTAPDHLNFGVKGYDKNLSPLDFSNAQTGQPQNSFYDKDTPRVINQIGVEYWFRAVILRADEYPNPNVRLNFLNGTPLLSHKDMRYFTPVITQTYQSGDKALLIRDIKVKPLQLSIERGYLSSILPIATYFYNNSGREESYIKNFTEQYLLSYKNNVLLPTYLTGVDIMFFVLTVNWVPTAGGVVVGAGTYRAGDIATIRITPSVGYQIDSVEIDGEMKPVSNQYLVSMSKNIVANVVFKKSLMNFVTSKRAFSFEGTQYDGKLVVDWGDGVTTTDVLTHRYTDNQAQHVIVINDGDITTLNVPDNEIISVSFTNMPNIDVLNMDNNLLTQIDISSLTKVTSISLKNNKLSNLSLTANPNVNYLDLGRNNFSSLDLSNLVSLKNLLLNDNKLTSLNVSSNVALINMNIDNNQLTSLNLGNATSLKSITAYNNKLTAFAVPSSNILVDLNIGKNNLSTGNFTGAGYPKLVTLLIADMPAMTSLTVTGVSLLTTLTASKCPAMTTAKVTDNSKLPSVDISGCGSLLTADCGDNPVLTNVNVLNDSKLQSLRTDNTSISTMIDLSTNSNLATLSMDNNKLTTFSAPYCTKLANLSLSNNQLTSITLTNNTELKNVDVDNNQLTSLNLSSHPGVRGLNCSHNLLTDSSAASIVTSNNLVNVDASYNNFTQFTISNKPQLKFVELHDCPVLKTATATNNALMETLDVSNNPVLETLNGYNNALETVNISTDNALKFVYLYNNQIHTFNYTGCKNIVNLNLNQNLLTSFDPNAIGESLQVLNISENLLTTLNLTNTVNLTTLNCDNNNLTNLTFTPEGGSTAENVEDVVNSMTTPIHIAYLLNGNMNKMNKSLLEFSSIVGQPSYVEGYEEGRQALQMGSIYAELPLTMSSNVTSEVSGSFMIYPTDVTSYQGLCGGVFFGLNTGQFGWAIGWGQNTFQNKLTVDLYTRSGRQTCQAIQLTPNRWQHVMFRFKWNGGPWLTEIYVDGVKYTASTTPGGDTLSYDGLLGLTGTEHISFGRGYQSGWNLFKGRAQDVIITDRYFSDNDVQLLINYYKNVGALRFPKLELVNCSYNELTTLDLSTIDYVRKFNCSYNQLGKNQSSGQPSITFGKALAAGNKLEDFNASNNQLKFIDLANNSNLISVNLNDNPDLVFDNEGWWDAITKVQVWLSSNTSITEFGVVTPSLVKLDLSKNKSLTRLIILTSTNLEYLDLSDSTNILEPWVYASMLQSSKMKELYLRNLTQFKPSDAYDGILPLYFMEGLEVIDISGSTAIRTEVQKSSGGTVKYCANLRWMSVENCKQLERVEVFSSTKIEYLNFAGCSSVTDMVVSSETPSYKEIHAENSYIVTQYTGNYNAFLNYLNSTTGGKYYYSNDDIYLREGGSKRADVLAKGWNLILVD